MASKTERPNPEHLLAGSKITVSVKVTSGMPKAKTARFVFLDANSDAELGGLDVDVEKHAFSKNAFQGTFELPAPEATADSYPLRCRFDIGDEQIPYPQEWVVWHGLVKLSLQLEDSEAGGFKPFGFAPPVTLTQFGESRELIIGSEGTTSFEPQPGPFDLAVPGPVQFLQYEAGKDVGPERVLQCKVAPCRARIASPPGADSEPLPWVINVPGQSNEVKVDLVSASASAGVVANQTLHVQVSFTNDTRRGKGEVLAPDADYLREATVIEGLGNMQTSGDRKSGESTVTGVVTTGPDGKGSITVCLGKGGGEVCEIRAGSTEAADDTTLTLVTWRKMFVQFCHSGTARTLAAFPPDKREATVQAYAAVFIETEFLDDKQYADDISFGDGTVGGRNGWHPGDAIGADDARVFVMNVEGDSWRRLPDKVMPDPAPPDGLFMNVAACDFMFEVANVSTGKVVTSADQASTWELHGDELWTSAHKNMEEKKRPHFGSQDKLGILAPQVMYQRMKTGEKNNPKITLDPQTVTVKVSSSPKSRGGKATVTLPQAVADNLDGGAKVFVMLDAMLVVPGGGAAGMNCGNAVVLGHEACGDAETNNTVIHELGHAIGMCGNLAQLGNKGFATIVDRLPDYKVAMKLKSDGTSAGYAYTEHSRWYDERGHLGNHCANGLGQSSYDKWGKLDGWSPKNIAGYNCVIYGQAQLKKSPVTYCAECQDMLKAMEVWVGQKTKPAAGAE